jgi:hypothetical protein
VTPRGTGYPLGVVPAKPAAGYPPATERTAYEYFVLSPARFHKPISEQSINYRRIQLGRRQAVRTMDCEVRCSEYASDCPACASPVAGPCS